MPTKKLISRNIERIIISRTDSIGDVILTLPVAGVLKELNSGCRIIFLGARYTHEVANACVHIDEFADWTTVKSLSRPDKVAFLKDIRADAIIHVFPDKQIASAARNADIPLRTGTFNRIYHWNTCNDLVFLSRKKSDLHEAQLNLKLLVKLGAKRLYSKEEIPAYYGFNRVPELRDELTALLKPDKFNLILHPCSKGSAKEWDIENYIRLASGLPQEKVRIFITGTEQDGLKSKVLSEKLPYVHDLTGKMHLGELISFINTADGLLAASTGPLHIAAALGKYAMGLYPSMRPINAIRWAPLGPRANFIEEDLLSTDRNSSLAIPVEKVMYMVMKAVNGKF
ncbi:MAG: glycosyltransferase family 9 protein [Bacteroidia bacterium]|nr:glycosyltransferase family 9 protein [Bacteroidia bacterium]